MSLNIPNTKSNDGIDDDLFDDLYEPRKKQIKEEKYLSPTKLIEYYKQKYNKIKHILVVFKSNETEISNKYKYENLVIHISKLYITTPKDKNIPVSLLDLYNEFKAKRFCFSTSNKTIIKKIKKINKDKEFLAIHIDGNKNTYKDIKYYPISLINGNLKESTIDSINEEIQNYEEFINANTCNTGGTKGATTK